MNNLANIFSKDRVAIFNDAVIAIAITLLVLEVRPQLSGALTNNDVWLEMRRLLPALLSLTFSFWTISRLWIGNLQFFKAIRVMDLTTLQYNLLFLFIIALLPFSSEVLASTHLMAATASIYGGTVAIASLVEAAMWNRLLHSELREVGTSELAVFYRVLQYEVSGLIFAISIPLAFISPYISVAVWITLGFTRLFNERSAESIRKFEDHFTHRRTRAQTLRDV